MNIKNEKHLDHIGIKILKELQKNARSSFSGIGRKVGLSSPAVAERVYKMEESGIINGYHADIHPDISGHSIIAYIMLTTQSDKYTDIYSFAGKDTCIAECHHISGNESILLKVVSSLTSIIKRSSIFSCSTAP